MDTMKKIYNKPDMRDNIKKEKNKEHYEHLNMPLTKMLKLDKPPKKQPLPKHKDIFESKLNHKLTPVVKSADQHQSKKIFQKYG
jgi:hypothetical protein